MKFKGHTDNGNPLTNWKKIYAQCRKYHQFIIEVREYSQEAEISMAQMAYWHCMPIKLFSEHTGYTLWKSEQWLKRECGAQWFMLEVEEECTKRGQIMFECQNPQCRQLFLLPGKLRGKYVCRDCHSTNIRMFFMLSKTELSVNDFTQVLQNTWDFMESIDCHCPPPDPQWRINQSKEKERELVHG